MHEFGSGDSNYKQMELPTAVSPTGGTPEPFGPHVISEHQVDLASEPPFQYKYHPRRWSWMDNQWLPVLAKLRLDPGVDGVSGRGGGDPRPGIRVAILAALRRAREDD